jgi:hypothetical protein
MRVVDFVEEVIDETRGSGGLIDDLPVVVKLPDGKELQVKRVHLTYHPGSLVIEIEKW